MHFFRLWLCHVFIVSKLQCKNVMRWCRLANRKVQKEELSWERGLCRTRMREIHFQKRSEFDKSQNDRHQTCSALPLASGKQTSTVWYDAGKVCNGAHCSELVADNLFERRKQKEQVKRTQEEKRKKPGEVRRCPTDGFIQTVACVKCAVSFIICLLEQHKCGRRAWREKW